MGLEKQVPLPPSHFPFSVALAWVWRFNWYPINLIRIETGFGGQVGPRQIGARSRSPGFRGFVGIQSTGFVFK